MPLTPYRRVLAVPGVPSLTLLGIVARMPNAGTGVIVTVHVVQTLGRSYVAAGLVVAALTIGTAIGAPWRGRMVDRLGLRRALLPSLLAEAVVWCSAPWLSYWWLVGAVAVGGLFSLPVFTVIRLALSAMVPAELRRTAFSLDSVSVEVSFMVAPALGILVATHISTTVALIALGTTSVLAGIGLIVMNPPTLTPEGKARAAGHPSIAIVDGPKPKIQVTSPLVLVLVATSAATVVLAGTDVSIIASLRSTDQLGWTGLVASVWAFASLLGGVVYGAIPRSIPPTWLLLGLGALTIPVALFSGPLALCLAMFPAGFLCAPVITATAEVIAELVPEQVRGEAMGWHGSALTAGIAAGAPLAGFAIDKVAPWAGFVTVGVVGTVVAVVGLATLSGRARSPDRPGARPEGLRGT
ncbi:MFS transporter [Angustibacter sp. McL0619]|uniref:MFS transporter n=1 Tax=Angustibacter sp. McL0619 TaxID=3415676 RepID=UPI003CF9654B